MIKLCAPAIIYLIFSITQILIDTFKGLYNTAIIKIIVTIMVTLLLNILCEKGLGTVSWIIVFIPFMLMTVIVSVVLYVFGLDTATGQFDYTKCTTDTSGNTLVYSPQYNPNINPVYYQYPNVVVPTTQPTTTSTTPPPPIPTGSSSPAYQS